MASLIGADLLVILSDVEGLFTVDPVFRLRPRCGGSKKDRSGDRRNGGREKVITFLRGDEE